MTKPETNPNDFFIAGGTMRASAASYVTRPADDELFDLAAQGAFCYVLTPRQMGKSSLMTRTAKRLSEQGIRAGIVDLTQIGAKVTVEQWYLGILSQLRRSLRLKIDYAEWWNGHNTLGEVQRFTDFLREVVLGEIQERVVIFIDEIDSTLQLDFRDDFFAAIRAMYNARAESPEFQRLSFVLLGVASPPDLIRDLTRTPFNIGLAIALKEFSRTDAAVLQNELEKQFPSKGIAIFERVYNWTNGHPYLTQKLCLTIAEKPQEVWDDAKVDALVTQMFLTEDARKESNLQYVQNNILSHPLKLPMLKVYREVIRGKVVAETQSPMQNQLKLSGLVKAEDGKLQVRNRVYAQVFGGTWVKVNNPFNWKPIVITAITVLSLTSMILASLLGYDYYIQNIVVANHTNVFFSNSDPTKRLASLAGIFRASSPLGADYDDKARELFFGINLSRDDQLALFGSSYISHSDSNDLAEVIKGLYVTLADVSELDNATPLLEEMSNAANSRLSNFEDGKLQRELNAWLMARKRLAEGQLLPARDEFKKAIDLNPNNPATRYEHARVLVNISQFQEALVDLSKVLDIAETLPTPIMSAANMTITSQVKETESSDRVSTTATPNTPGPISGTVMATSKSQNNVTVSDARQVQRFTSEFLNSIQMRAAVTSLVLQSSPLEKVARNKADWNKILGEPRSTDTPILINPSSNYCEELLTNLYIWTSNSRTGLKAECETDPALVSSGNTSLKLSSTNCLGRFEVYSRLLPVSPNQTYTVSYMVRTKDLTIYEPPPESPQNASMWGKVIVSEYMDGATETDNLQAFRVTPGWERGNNMSGTNDWTFQSYSFATAPNTKFVRMRGIVSGTESTACGEMWLDMVAIR